MWLDGARNLPCGRRGNRCWIVLNCRRGTAAAGREATGYTL